MQNLVCRDYFKCVHTHTHTHTHTRTFTPSHIHPLTHTHTQALTHTSILTIQNLICTQFKMVRKQRLETDENSSTECSVQLHYSSMFLLCIYIYIYIYISCSGQSQVGSLFTNEEEKRLAHDLIIVQFCHTNQSHCTLMTSHSQTWS